MKKDMFQYIEFLSVSCILKIVFQIPYSKHTICPQTTDQYLSFSAVTASDTAGFYFCVQC